MNVLLPDTSVLVDLERGEILETIFRLPFDFAVPSLLYKWNSRTTEEMP